MSSADVARQLRLVRHKHAARVAFHARNLQIAAKQLRKLNAAMHAEARAIAGADYDDTHTVNFEPCNSIEDQLDDDICPVMGAGLADVLAYADAVLQDATATAAVPAADTRPLPSEY
jgi:hypothetical protein